MGFRAGSHQCYPMELSDCSTQGLLLPLLPSNLAKGPGFGAARGVQIWGWNPQKLCAEDCSHLLCSPQLCLSSMARSSTRSPRVGQHQWLCHIRWYNLDHWWPIQTPAVELLQLQWVENNHVKGWYPRRLKQIMGRPHPNIFEIIDAGYQEGASYNRNEVGAVCCRHHLKRRDTRWEDLQAFCKVISFSETPNWALAVVYLLIRTCIHAKIDSWFRGKFI